MFRGERVHPGRRDRGELERAVLAVVAAAGVHALTPGQVRERLGAGLAYTTVMTTLTRLHDKGVLRREQSGRAFAYGLAAVSDSVEDVVIAARMRRLLDGGGNRAGVLSRFVSDLEPGDEELLRQFLMPPEGTSEHLVVDDGVPEAGDP